MKRVRDLTTLCHYRWTIPVLEEMCSSGPGEDLWTIECALLLDRKALLRTIFNLERKGLMTQFREHRRWRGVKVQLTPEGRRLRPRCSSLLIRLKELGVVDVALNKWSLPIVYAIGTHSRRFNNLKTILQYISSRALIYALRSLQQADLVATEQMDGNSRRVHYTLTRCGSELLPLLQRILGLPDIS